MLMPKKVATLSRAFEPGAAILSAAKDVWRTD